MTCETHSSIWSNYVMTHYQLMGTEQKCECCGTTRKGSVASEVFVYAKNIRTGQVKSIPREELMRRYELIFDINTKTAWEYMPELPRRLVWATVSVKQCSECFVGLSSFSSRDSVSLLPETPKVRPGPIQSPNSEEELKRRRRSLSIHLGKGTNNKVSVAKPVVRSLADLLS